MAKEKICFIISPIGEPKSDRRKRADLILKHIIAPALKDCGYKPERADQIDKPGIITHQVIQHIIADPLVIADLTDFNPNVFYELALRHFVRKPLIHMIKQGQELPFDVSQSRTIYFDHQDPDSEEAANKEIIKQIKALEQDPSAFDTPISVSLDLQAMRQSDKPEQRSMAEVLSAISELRRLILGSQRVLSELNTRVPEARGIPFDFSRPLGSRGHVTIIQDDAGYAGDTGDIGPIHDRP